MGKRQQEKEFEALRYCRRLILPRLIRLRDVHYYLGMDRNRFSKEVRPYLTEIPIGKQGIAFDRIDLDAWADAYKDRYGRPPKATWSDRKTESSNRRKREIKEFEEAVKKAMSRKRTST